MPLSIVKSGSGYRAGLSSPKLTALQAPRCPKCSASGDTDSPVEQEGFELPVPLARELLLLAKEKGPEVDLPPPFELLLRSRRGELGVRPIFL